MTRTKNEILAALQPLLEQALSLSPEERAAWVQHLRLAEPALAPELEALLAEERALEARHFLQGEHWADLFDGTPALAGQRVGAYAIERPLGQGGMGTVWLARRSDGRFEGKAAVKLLNLALLDSFGRERFRREGSALARLTHPNIARLIDAGVTDGGQPFLILEYVEGRRIDLYCDEGRLPPGDRLRLFLQVLAAVGHAHANLLVHRDLKPSNILVTADGSVKLLDFGIAKLLEGDGAGAEPWEITDLGAQALTPEFAAPEQVTGGPVTTATDVYALGVLLYFLLAGRHPTGEGCRTAAEHLRALVDTEPERLSTGVGAGASDPGAAARLAEARGVPSDRLRRLYLGDLDNILAKALKKRPEDRYRTVSAFADDLSRYLRHEPVEARPSAFGYRLGKFVRRNLAAVGSGVLAAAVLVGAIVVTYGQKLAAERHRVEAERQGALARLERDRARSEEHRAAASSDFLAHLLESVAPSGRAYTMEELLDTARIFLEMSNPGDPRFAARMMVELSSHYFDLDDRDREIGLLVRAGELADSAGDAETAAHAGCGLARRRAQDGNPAEARQMLERANRRLAQVREPAPAVKVECLRARSSLARAEGKAGDAIDFAREAVALGAEAGDTFSRRHVDALTTLETALQAGGHPREALEVSRTARSTLERQGRGGTLPATVLVYNQAYYLLGLGRFRLADSLLTQAMFVAGSTNDRRDVPAYMKILAAELACELARPELALRTLPPAKDRLSEGGDRTSEVWIHLVLSRALIEARRFPEAEAAIDRISRLVDPRERWRADLLRARLARGRGEAARAHRILLGLLAARGIPERAVDGRFLRDVVIPAAGSALETGDAAGADSLSRHALRLAALGGQNDSSGIVGDALVTLARARRARGDLAGFREALARGERALAAGYGPDHPRTREARALVVSAR